MMLGGLSTPGDEDINTPREKDPDQQYVHNLIELILQLLYFPSITRQRMESHRFLSSVSLQYFYYIFEQNYIHRVDF